MYQSFRGEDSILNYFGNLMAGEKLEKLSRLFQKGGYGKFRKVEHLNEISHTFVGYKGKEKRPNGLTGKFSALFNHSFPCSTLFLDHAFE